MNKFNSEEFYPTPAALLDKITEGIKWSEVKSILEPSAGKGDIADYITEKYNRKTYGNDADIDCVESDNDLRCTLKGKGYKVVHDDFLTFQTFKHYDLIVMNPPFSNGAAHLTKALDMQKDGGAIVCILNAETIRNPYTNERKALIQRLESLNADIQYLQGEFTSAERPTGVEIAVIKVLIPEPERTSRIYEEMKKKYYAENNYQTDMTDLAVNDYIKAMVAMFNMEVESGINLIREYKDLSPYIMNDFKTKSYSRHLLQLRVGDKDTISTNKYVKLVREKYWSALFRNPKFTGNMTSNLAETYSRQVNELSNYDFSVYNIKCIQEEMSRNLIKGIEDCIIELFDKLSYQYSYSDELSKNIHYFNGWKTNKCWIINKKVILPNMNAFKGWSGKFEPDYYVKRSLMDIEKALNYLDGGLTECKDMELCLRHAAETGQTKKIPLKYFTVTFFKKGTCHIEFTNEELLKKLNIFGSQHKKWLPPGYGKKSYTEMDSEEKAVIDEFEGKESYEDIVRNAKYFIYDPKTGVPMLEDLEAAS